MKKLALLFLFCCTGLFAQYKDGEQLLRAMHKKYYHNYCQTVTFDQRTVRYDSTGSVTDTSYWYEWISYPDKFRIDFGKKFGGNCVIFKNDSVFNYRNHKLVRKGQDENDLLLLLGGMYFRPIDSVLARLKRAGYEFHIQKWFYGDQECYLLTQNGPGPVPASGYKIAIDKKDLKVVALQTKLTDKDWLHIQFTGFKKTCKGFTETKVEAKKNNVLEQKEEYLNLKTSIAIPDSIFNKKP